MPGGQRAGILLVLTLLWIDQHEPEGIGHEVQQPEREAGRDAWIVEHDGRMAPMRFLPREELAQLVEGQKQAVGIGIGRAIQTVDGAPNILPPVENRRGPRAGINSRSTTKALSGQKSWSASMAGMPAYR